MKKVSIKVISDIFKFISKNILPGIIAGFVVWLLLFKFPQPIEKKDIKFVKEIGRDSRAVEIYVKVQLTSMRAFNTKAYDLKVKAYLKGTASANFKEILRDTFFVSIPLAENGEIPVLSECMEFPIQLTRNFYNSIVKQLKHESFIKKEIENILNTPDPPSDEKISLFEKSLRLYGKVIITISYTDSFTGLRRCLLKEVPFDKIEIIY